MPDPDKQQNAEMKSIVAAANDAIRSVQSVVSKKCGDYASYDQCIRAKIGRFTCQHGTAAAAELHQYYRVLVWSTACLLYLPNRYQQKQETNCLIMLSGKSAKLKCSEFST